MDKGTLCVVLFCNGQDTITAESIWVLLSLTGERDMFCPSARTGCLTGTSNNFCASFFPR